jgi:hypothetical protein
MAVHNAEIADLFERLADLLEIEGVNPFRVRAYRNATRVIRGYTRSLAELIDQGEDLEDLPNIGADLAEKIRTIVDSGELPVLTEVESRTPAALSELMKIQGLGPKRVKALYDELDIRSLDDLQRAVNEGELGQLTGFGRKEDGTLDLLDGVLKELDLTVCSVHYKFDLTSAKQTERILRAMDNPYFNILAHPTGRRVHNREPYDVDLETVMEGARDRGCFLEVNANPDRLDLKDELCKMARDMGVKLAISTDAHSTADLDYIGFGVDQGRRGWLESEDVINTRPLATLRKLLKRK